MGSKKAIIGLAALLGSVTAATSAQAAVVGSAQVQAETKVTKALPSSFQKLIASREELANKPTILTAMGPSPTSDYGK